MNFGMAENGDSCQKHIIDKTQMLTISSKSRYGTAALMALAEFYNSGLLQIKDIASRCDIPQQYLENRYSTDSTRQVSLKAHEGRKEAINLPSLPTR